MKTLKKTLAFVLVIAMAFGTFAMSANAALDDYSDSTDVTYTEALDVLVGLGVIDGIDGEIQPTGTLTREQAAKIITYMVLGATIADALTTSTAPYDDVAANRWSAGYIAYCVSEGIINGYGDGNFGPTDEVTGLQFAKMLLVAVGYGQNDEFIGSNWSIEVAKAALPEGVFAGNLGGANSEPATREEAMLYAFNALFIDAVVYSKDISDYTDNPKAGNMATDLFSLSKVTSPVNGVGGYTWKMDGVAISNFYTTDVVIGTSTNGTAISALSTATNAAFIATVDGGTEYYLNGTGSTANVCGTASDKAGVIVNFINTDSDAVAEKVTVIEKTVYTLTAAPSVATDGTVTITGVTGSPFAADKVVYPADLAKGDVVLYYKDDTGVTTIECATAVEGQMTAKYSNGDIKFADARYAESELVTAGVLAAYTTYNTDAVAYLDDNGTVVAIANVTAAPAATNYAILLDSAEIENIWSTSTYEAKLLFMDGTVEVVPFTKVDAVAVSGTTTPEGIFYSYALDVNGNYELTTVTAAGSITLPDATDKAITPKTALFNTVTVGNSATVFIVEGSIIGATAGTYVTYTGINNVPALNGTTDMKIIATSGVATYVYVDSGALVAAAAVADVAYFVDSTSYTYYPAVGTASAYYVFDAIVDGAVTTVKVAVNQLADVSNGLWAVEYTNDIITNADKTDLNTVTGAKTAVAANGVITLATTAYTYDSNTVVYYIAASGAVTVGTIADVVADANDTFIVSISSATGASADLIAELYIRVV